MFKKNNWLEPIYKNDVISVILNGLFSAILGGILAGVVDFLFNMINISISIGLIIICYMIGSRMKKGYDNYHILYPVLSIIFMIIALIFADFAFYFCLIPELETFKLLMSWNFYLNVIISPVYYLILMFSQFDISFLIFGILNLAIYIYSFIICYRIVKGRN